MTDTSETAPPAPPTAAIRSSQSAIDLIVAEEDSDEAYYTKHYQHFEWPEGASGPTVGIGYDCGYATADQIRSDWLGFIPDAMVGAMVRAAGLKAEAAHVFVQRYGASVTITWDQALAQFKAHELPKWETIVQRALPNTDALNGDCFGALVSLTYNRGASYQLPGARFTEMRAIWTHMGAKRFDAVPGDLLAMRRLWPVHGDLWNRRGHEAALFEQGLKAMAAGHVT
jgi:hypothetical protein